MPIPHHLGRRLGRGHEAPDDRAIAQFDDHVFAMDIQSSGTCNGDSGGPALLNEDGVDVVAGIHSRSDCETTALDERVDAHLESFIQPFIAGPPAPTCDEDEACAAGCAQPDPGCPCAGDSFRTPA